MTTDVESAVRWNDHTVAQLVVFAVVVALTVYSAYRVQISIPKVSNAAAIRSDDELFRHQEMLGPEFVIYDWIRTNLPPGEKISINFRDDYHNYVLKRVTRLWLALLPDYPISRDGRYAICPVTTCENDEGSEIVVPGRLLTLIERRGGSR